MDERAAGTGKHTRPVRDNGSAPYVAYQPTTKTSDLKIVVRVVLVALAVMVATVPIGQGYEKIQDAKAASCAAEEAAATAVTSEELLSAADDLSRAAYLVDESGKSIVGHILWSSGFGFEDC